MCRVLQLMAHDVQVPIFKQADLRGQKCKVLACGDHNTAVLTVSGRVLVAGDNSHGQCGMPFAEPPRVACFKDVGPDPDWAVGVVKKPRYAQSAAEKQHSEPHQPTATQRAQQEDIIVCSIMRMPCPPGPHACTAA